MPAFDLREFLLLAPEILLAIGGLALLLAGSVGRGVPGRVAASLSLFFLVATALLVLTVEEVGPEPRLILGSSFVLDGFARFFKLVILAGTALTVLISVRFVDDGAYRAGEYHALLLLATTGMMFMVGGFNLVSIWIALELMALSSYILAGYFKRETRSNEAALKYFVLGALSSAILLYGASLLYGATGELRLDLLAAALPEAMVTGRLLVPTGWLMLSVGLLFKVAAVPFHVWTPDVYVGAPTPVTAYLAAASKTASFAILVRIFVQGLPTLLPDWQIVIAAVASVTMIWGNLAALTQTNVKRMLAYSSIAHAGYVLLGLLAASVIGLWSVAFYLLAYTFITLGAFAMVVVLERREYAGEEVSDYAGLARRAPWLAAAMLVFLLALTGIPPTGGFVGKVYLFAAAVEAGWTWVAVIGVLTSAISLYYYFSIAVQMYLKESTRDTPEPLGSPALTAAIATCVVATLVLGLFPGPFIEFAQAAGLPLP